MSLKFAIRNTASKAEKEGDTFIRYSGTAEPFNRHSERDCKKVGVDGGGNPRLIFTTGLNVDKIPFYDWYNVEEKKVLKDLVDNLTPVIKDYYGGPEVIDASNFFFWKENRDINRLSLTHENIDVFYDTDKPSHALLYLSIVSGAFIDLVAPTREWAESRQIPHYLALEVELNDVTDEDEDIKRSDAHALLGELRRDSGKDALYILAWCIQYDTKSFGAYSYATSEKDLINYHIKFIDGKLQTKKKKNCPKTFIDYAEKWKGQQTRPLLYTEAYLKAGEYFNFVYQKEKKYTTSEGTILGNTVTEAVNNLMKPKFTLDLQSLRDKVETKWKE